MYEQAINTSPVPTGRSYTYAETVFAWASLLLGYLFCRAFPATEHPLGAFIFTFILFSITAVVLAFDRAAFGIASALFALSAYAMSFSLIFTQNGVIHFFASLYCIIAYGMFVYTGCGNHNKSTLARVFPLDFFKALFISPFMSFTKLGKGLKANGRLNTKPLLKVIVGIIMAVVPTAVVLLLLSYDSDFRELLDKIFDFDIGKLFSHVGSIIWGIPVGAYIYGAFISAVDRRTADVCPEDKVKDVVNSMRFVPKMTAVAAVLPILCVYVLFFISQWKYYVSGFIGVLPDETSYAEYAREGFFQLCAVAVINFIIIVSIGIFMRRSTDAPSVAERILSFLLSVSTLILITTALAKMFMYIDIYGLTPKRVYATWFMLVLAGVFIIMLIKQFASKLPHILISFCFIVLMFAVLAFGQTDRVIAEYNVDRYLDGTLDDVDTVMLEKMGDAAIPSMVKVVKAWEEKYGFDHKFFYEDGYKSTYSDIELNRFKYICNSLEEMSRTRDDSFWSYTLLRGEADRALAELGLNSSKD